MIFKIIIDFFHLLATVTWIGGMIYVNFVLIPSLPAIDPPQRGKLLGAVTKRFIIISWISIFILLISGVLLTLSEKLFNISTASGAPMTIKHILFLAMIVIGLLITFVLTPKLNALAPKPGEKPTTEFQKAQKRLSVLALTNMILGILVLICAAISNQ